MDPIVEEKQQEIVIDDIPCEDSSESVSEANDEMTSEETVDVAVLPTPSVETDSDEESPNEEVEQTPSGENETDKQTDENVEELNPIMSSINELSDKIEQLRKQFDAKIMHTSHEEKIVDQMHAELQKYKEDMYAQLVRPILLDIIEMRDSIMRVSKAYAEKPTEEQIIPLKTFSDYAYDVQDILEKNNINIYKSEDGDSFTPLKQRVIKKINTPVEELHGKVAESLSDGYEYLGKTISPEKIAVYVYDSSEKKEGEQE